LFITCHAPVHIALTIIPAGIILTNTNTNTHARV